MEALFNLGGSILGGGLGYLGMKQANAQNRDAAREQMAFQERMSSTAYQRAMEDMRKAGLNPMLAMSHGGASSPSGAVSQMQNALGHGVNSALETARARAEVKRSQADARKIESETRLNDVMASSARQNMEMNFQNFLMEFRDKKFKDEFNQTGVGAISKAFGEFANNLRGKR